MNKAYKLLTVSVIALLAMLCGACADDLFLQNQLGSQLTERGDYRVSRFKLQREVMDIPTDEVDITISLVSHTDSSETQFDATVEHFDTHQWIALLIPRSHKIADSDYDLTVTLANGKRVGTQLTVTFRDEMLYQINSRARVYDLSGKGTLEKPYLISSTEDFSDFQTGLSEDSLRGAGLYFKQTANITAPAASDAINGRLYAHCDFAGCYDGGKKTITLQYSGSGTVERDDSVGLFGCLLDGALVKNLTLNASIRGGNSCVGALSGTASGTVVLENVTVKGYVIANDHVGGFIGKVNGNLTASDCYLASSVSGSDYVGGLTGSLENGSLDLSTFTNLLKSTPEEIAGGADLVQMHDFTTIATASHVGGVAGYINGSFTLSDVILQHIIDGETTKVKVINADRSYAGGLIGEAVITSASTVSSIHSLAPVTASTEYSGGLFGKVQASAELSILSVTIGTQVLGGDYVGGFIGYTTSGSMISIGTASNGSECFLGQVRNGYVEIKGANNVGGLLGYLEGDIHPTSPTSLNINVTSTGSNGGGVAGKIYNGTLECQHFTIDGNMTITGATNTGGFVGYADHSTIRGNLNNNQSINAKSHPAKSSFASTFAGKVRPYDSSSSKTGGIIGYAYNTYISALCVSGEIEGYKYVGGIVGYLENTSRGYIYDCVNKGNGVKNASGDYTGGIIGLLTYHYGNQSDLINYSEVQGKNYTGGIVGGILIANGAPAFDISNIFNEGPISGTEQVGGCVGYIAHTEAEYYNAEDILVNNAGNFGNVELSGEGNVGGILGYGNSIRMIVSHSANHGKVSSTGEAKVGGIAGRMGQDPGGIGINISSNMELAYCCNHGEISSGSSLSNLGGLLGYQEEGHAHDETHWMTHDCYNAGEISSDQNEDNGGIIGYIDYYGEIGQCINHGKVKKGNGILGTHPSGGIIYHHNVYTLEGMGGDWCATEFSSSEKGKESTFEGLDFNSVWRLNDSNNDGFPSLRNCPFQFK